MLESHISIIIVTYKDSLSVVNECKAKIKSNMSKNA